MSLRNFPDANTSITLDFLKGKKLDPRITFDRASAATEIGEGTGAVNGQLFEFQENVPRLTDQGLLVEEARTNVELNSATLGDWTRNELTEATNNQVAPDGTTTSSTFTVTTTDAGHNLEMSWQNGGGSPPYPRPTYSVFVKPGTAKKIFIFDPNNARAAFDFTTSNPVVVHAHKLSNIDTAATCQSYGNGWYRISVSSSSSAWQSHNVYIGVYSTLPTGFGTDGVVIALSDFDYAGTGETVAFWGVQREQPRSSTPVPPTSYIRTSGAETTRAVDLVTLSTNWFNDTAGSFVLDVDVLGSSDDYPRLLQSNLSHNFEYQTLNSAPTAKALNFSSWLQGQATKTPYGTAPTGAFKIAANYSIGNKSSIYIDGTKQVRGGATHMPGTAAATFPTEFRLFRQSNGGQFLSGYVKFLRYYPTDVTDAGLEALTS